MIGPVSTTILGNPAVFTLHEGGIWEVEHRGIPDELLSATMWRLGRIVDDYGGPSDGPFGPRQIEEAARLLGGTAYINPVMTAGSPGVVH